MTSPGILPDVNLLLAYGWRSHADHQHCRVWFSGLTSFATCAITELGFLRVSMSPAYRARQEDASRVLETLLARESAAFLHCDLPTSRMAFVTAHRDTTDCYLVALAREHSFMFATLDEGILKAPWAEGVAFHPFRP